MNSRIGKLGVSYSSRGNPTYHVEVWHDGLKKHRQLKGSERGVVLRKAELQSQEWDARWLEEERKQAIRKARDDDKQHKENQKALAVQLTLEAQAEVKLVEGILEHTLSI